MKCLHCPVKSGGCVGSTPGKNGYAVPRYCHLAAKDNRYDEAIISASEGLVEEVETERPTTFLRDRELVVARYNEDVSWVKQVPMRVTIYNKGNPLDEIGDGIKIIDLPNVKREAGTMLQFIVTRYHSLPDLTIFLQGCPFDHASYFWERLTLPYDQPTTLTEYYMPHFPAQWIKDGDLVGQHEGYPVRYGDARINAHGDGSESKGWFNPTVWTDTFDAPLPDHVWFGYGAQWAVPRANILGRPLGFWQWLLDRCDDGSSGKSWTDPPQNPWSLESLWRYLFDLSVPIKWRPVPKKVTMSLLEAQTKGLVPPRRKCCGRS